MQRAWAWWAAAVARTLLVAYGGTGAFDVEARSEAPVWAALTVLGDEWVLVGVGTVAVAALWAEGHRERSLLMLGTSLAGWAVARGVKLLVSRPRPEGGALELSSYAFPSGHALGSLVVFGAWAWLAAPETRGIQVAAWSIAGLVGLSRIALGVHYVSDVIGGWLFAVALLATMQAIQRSRTRPGPDADAPRG